MSDLVALMSPIRRRLITAGLLHVVYALSALVPFVCVAELARALLGSTGAAPWTIVAIAAGALLVRFLAFGASGVISHFADADLQLHLRRRLAAKLSAVPLGWFTERNSGQVKKVLQDDVREMHHLVAHALLDLLAAAITPIAALAYLLWVDWRLTLVTLLPIPLFAAAFAVMMRGYGEQMRRWGEATARINAAVVEFVQGIAVVKTFGQTSRSHERFARAADDFADFFGAWVRPMLRLSGLSTALIAPPTMLLVTLAGGVVFTAQGWIQPVDVLPFVLVGVGLTAPFQLLDAGSMQLRQAAEAASRVAALLAEPVLPEPETPLKPDGARVEFRGVGFSYDGSTRVLEDIDLTLEPGTLTALVGPSGSGKSTLGRLLARFYDVGTGEVLVGGRNIKEIGSAELYRHVGFVFQDVQLLRASIADNIALGSPAAGRTDIEKVARAAQIHERIEQLPRGYDSVIGVDAHLSGGEMQRVSIARALLADAPILVLDEATAFADPESEAAIQDALSTLIAGRTVLVIAHRLHTITGADQIVVLDHGRVAEIGRQPELPAYVRQALR
ncbi:ABC transporter ATP-binding protein [Nonomuraea soli]|uniref:ATP-binding cassette subfamily B protein n=1 Tax=Nonomuraea soli TaxID=1032476 RepID=A0A7W0HWA3_9ACTN|nr:ABC transporter ATP-binding protein [Nonomuraea soli]MBA2898000.1 ATP-binding cassette subfamily B protein [Nonomuraea soli]